MQPLDRARWGGSVAAKMLRAFLLSVRQLGDPAIFRVLAGSIGLTLLIFLALGLGLWFGVRVLAEPLGAAGSGLAALAALLGTIGAIWLLFRAVAIAVIGIFADAVVQAVEARHYPKALTQARNVPFGRSVAMGLGSAGRAILVNLAMSPVYLALLLTGVGTAIAFFVVNGWLLGRDLGDMVAARHMSPSAIRDWRAATRWRRLLLGLAGTGLLVVPFVNLIAPVLGAAMATHMFHGKTMA
ncbi:EI24 domain-containing protein [Stakelama pacifica]|uniref:Uncharacterized protein involved in cysteine biosynthesis n=1 Tax=Stakelama pacifica TaxID=517720 RepID=A0A4R6FSK8_9SPHN|nr:EI24 domain-containing protein [Stakelama pacifica]TDN83775.1 uncharacterized protein involved in cysteine biosynthesis [Stakelama pacifica]GGO94788.1 hypothetical protein GCM10011329_17500 [Stakelama pacifica]